MGLFSRKSPEEKRINKFEKTEKRVIKSIKAVQCPIWNLYKLSANEDDYSKTAEYFRQWFLEYVAVSLPKLKFWADEEFWIDFTANCDTGMVSMMVLGDYEGCFDYCRRLRKFEDLILEKKIGRGKAGGFIGFAKIVAASAGVGGNEKQVEFIRKIRFYQAVCLYELGKHRLARNLLAELPSDYGLVFNRKDEYFNRNFKYNNGFKVSEFLKLGD